MPASSSSSPAAALDPAQFASTLQLCAVRVTRAETQAALKQLRQVLFRARRVAPVVDDPESGEHKLILLDRSVPPPPSALPPAVSGVLAAAGLTAQSFELRIGYDQMSAVQVLRQLLPAVPVDDLPHSFEIIGSIAHVKLKAALAEHKHTVGRVIMDKNPSIRTVVNKVESLDEDSNCFRILPMEVIAGEHNLETTVPRHIDRYDLAMFLAKQKQHGIPFSLDFSQVYWNSRLETEHFRIVSIFSPGQAICDMCCGIGPFAIPAALKGCVVYANDLNPQAVRWLRANCDRNRILHDVEAVLRRRDKAMQESRRKVARLDASEQGRRGQDQQERGDASAAAAAAIKQQLFAYEMDAREFVRSLVRRPARDGVLETDDEMEKGAPYCFDHVLMNLPKIAIEFLDVFKGLFRRQSWGEHPLPMIHCHCFALKNETEAELVARAERSLGGAIDNPAIHVVRDVSPRKHMYCISFRLPEAVAFAEPERIEAAGCSPEQGQQEQKKDGNGNDNVT